MTALLIWIRKCPKLHTSTPCFVTLLDADWIFHVELYDDNTARYIIADTLK